MNIKFFSLDTILGVTRHVAQGAIQGTALIVILLGISACAGIQQPQQDTPAELQTPWAGVWQNDLQQYNQAIQKLVAQADKYIADFSYDKAEVVLERALRINNRVASVWSRLGWLALQQSQYQRAQHLITRSNSHTSQPQLLRLNWGFYRDASEYQNDAAGVQRARQQLQQLNTHD